MSTRLSIFYFILLLFFASSALFSPVTGDLAGDRQALLDFLNNITHPRSLTWNASTPVCATWPGVTCDKDGTRVTALHLPGASLLGVIPPGTISRLSELQILSLRSNGLRGVIPPGTISRLSELQILSLRSNGLRGPFPVDFSQLTKLKAISLSNNRFSGPLPSDYPTWTNLTVLDLYGNRFNGSVPAGFANLTGLDSLNLAENSFSGEIPDLNLPGLRRLNFSNNNLTGSIPKSLRRFGNSAFSGNNLVYENASPPPVIPPIEKEKEKKGIYISKPAILAIAISLCFVIFFLIAVVIIVCYVKRQRRQETETTPEKLKPAAQKMPSEKEVSKLGKEKNIEDMEDKSEINRVMFFEGSNLAFNLEDLLIASAEFLGKGTFGMTYKAVLEDSKVIAVKRLKDVVVSRKDFKHQMEIVGNIRHENVAPLRAYVCSKEEKLMVYDYYSEGSLSHLLHGKNGEEGHVPLNWETRLRFMIGVAKGLAHIHTYKLAHGNIKSSNVFMNSEDYGCISETGLAVLTNPVTRANASARRYRAPEATDTRRSTPESDVYGFGILMLETLTGRSSMDDAKEGIDLVVWVNEVIAKQWTGEVFDLELVKTPNVEAKLLQMLQLGTSCTARVPAKRPEMVKVVETLEEIERKL
ncbi:PREDICTED: inactive leucine-rich repeat receptor-like serine/threonine-protein kinase At5g24100 [Camelina sativa]|uniref:Inactive leucine-rich repeat receptor-like serine/threonine-protein kinase At5g24100 n=1 Tax=Camelina sativa TaxID=90675 RepID=A0ABM1QBV2_CAMSA|nr:PREDICTED: inactive leucine-rich repeat receptor-like serine/threonine-protein kinase At5g24100 [Camelina sativa]